MAEHIEIVLSITGTLFMLILGLIAWQGNRQIRRIDRLETRLMNVEENTNKSVNNIKDNYIRQFQDVRKDISELKENNAVHFGDIKCSITEIKTTLGIKND